MKAWKKSFISMFISFISMPSLAGNILFIGDSHSVGPFGWRLDDLLRSLPTAQVETHASCGSIAKWWWKGTQTPCGYYGEKLGSGGKNDEIHLAKAATPNFTQLMTNLKPRLVVVELGANYATIPNDEVAIADMKKMVDEIKASGAHCFWITKPDARKNPESIPRILDLTYKAVDEYCFVFDSTKVTKYPATGGDGVHYWFKEGTPIANKWAETAFEEISALIKSGEIKL